MTLRRDALKKSWLKATNLLLAAALLAVSFVPRARADEGMWTFDNPPLRLWKERYNFEPSQAWLERLRLEDAEIVDDDLNVRVSPDDFASRVGGAQIGGERQRASFLQLIQLLDRRIDRLRGAAIDDHPRSFFDQCLHNRIADACRTAAHQSEFSPESEIQECLHKGPPEGGPHRRSLPDAGRQKHLPVSGSNVGSVRL